MRMRLRPLADQVIVITGATSGIGLTTARRAAERGARVVLCARDEQELRQAVEGIERAGGRARYAVADVASEAEVTAVADTAVREFGGIDTWVNNAGVSLYGRLTEVALEDMRRLFEVNFWGTVHGCRAAIPHLRERGGALINIGSIVSDRAIPLQGVYSASKQALKGFTDALRMELEEEDASISVTLVKPSSIDTPFFQHAKDYMEVQPKPPAPVYAPDVVAEAILRAAEQPVREVTVGGGGRLLTAMAGVFPRITDRVMERTMFRAQRTDRPVEPDRADNLHEPPPVEGRERGGYSGHVLESSLYTRTALSPAGRTLLAAGLGLALYAGIRSLGKER